MLGSITARGKLGLAALVALLAPATAFGHAGRASPAAVRLSRHPLAANRGWTRYDEALSQSVARPLRVLDVTGAVADPQALADPSGGQATTLTYPLGGKPPSLVLDYGQDVGGFPQIDAAAGAGVIQATYSETLANLGDDGATTVALFLSGNGLRADTFPVLSPGVRTAATISGGERYEKLTLTTPGTVTLRAAGIELTPPRDTPDAMAGHFLSSDPLLNRIWYAGAYTLDLDELSPGTPTTLGQINELHLLLDGAKRDRAVWSGDQQISDLTDYYTSDPAYAHDSLMLFLTHPASSAGFLSPAFGSLSQPGPLPGACSPNPLAGNICVTWSASYSLAVIPALYNYYLFTGDLGFVRTYWQAVLRQMQWAARQVDAHGLFAVNTGDAHDWNLESPTGEVTYVNALYVEALDAAGKLAAALGQSARAGQFAGSAAAVAGAVNRFLWDPATGVYDPSSALRGPVVQDANVIAILAGIAGGARARGILGVLRARLGTPFGPAIATANATGYIRDISPYMGSFNVLADFASGDEAAALALIRGEWGFMVEHDPGGVDWERIELNGVPAGTSGPLAAADSSAHAWSTGPTAALSEYVLGVAPVAPGYARWSVSPQLGGLRWAQGVVPTPHGPLTVRWQRTARKRSLVLTIAAPAGTSGTVAIPLLYGRATIARNGRIIWSHGRPAPRVRARRRADAVVFSTGAGGATFAEVR